MNRINTIIIGAGQAGISTSYYLKQENIPHIILEEYEPFHNWKDSRWDSFSLVTPNWMNKLPGFPYKGSNPLGFLKKEEVEKYLEDYIKSFDPPIKKGEKVLSVKRMKEEYVIQTADETYCCENLVVATGIYNEPCIPSMSERINKDVFQIHSNDYKNPKTLPPGNVLVVGAGRSGLQIAYELNRDNRKVFLCVGNSGNIPLSYRGYHGTFWLNLLAGYGEDQEIQKELIKNNRKETGDTKGKLSLGLCQKEGVNLLGRLIDLKGETKIRLGDDLEKNIIKSQRFLKDFKDSIDDYLKKKEILQDTNRAEDHLEEITMDTIPNKKELDLESENITSIIWSTGYKYNYNWIELPVFDPRGYPIQKQGITSFPGLYFIGLHLMPKIKEKINFGVGLFAVGEDAKTIAQDIIRKSK